MSSSALRLCVVGSALAAAAPLQAQDAALALTAAPQRCVALQQGQTCYLQVQFSWPALDDQYNYCLVEDGREKPLHCWLGGSAGEYLHEFRSAVSRRYTLRRGDDRVIAETQVQVAWVYKTRRRSSAGWRLF